MITINIEGKNYDLPTEWNEVPFKVGKQIMDIEESNIFIKYIKSIQLLNENINIDDLYKIDSKSFQELATKIAFIEIEPTPIGNKIIEIEGVKYAMAQDINSITVGEWVDLEMLIKDENITDNLYKVLGILVREVVGESEEFGKLKWEIEPYNGPKAMERAEFFNEKMGTANGLSFCNFFLILEQIYIRDILHSLVPKTN